MSLSADELIKEIYSYFDKRLDYEPEIETSMNKIHHEQLDDEISRLLKESQFTLAPIHDVLHIIETAIKILEQNKYS